MNVSDSVLSKVLQLIDCSELRTMGLCNNKLTQILSNWEKDWLMLLKALNFTNWNSLVYVTNSMITVGSLIGKEGVKKLVNKDWPVLKTIRLGDL